MKKRIVILCLLALVAGCSGNSDELAPYRHKTAAQIFHTAEANLAKKKYEKASKALEALDAIYPFGPYAQQGQLDSIYAYYMSGDDPSAVTAADRYIRLYPRGRSVDYAYYMKGVISSFQGYTWLQRTFGADPAERDLVHEKSAFLAFSEIVDLYPRSPYAPNALMRMRYLRNIFARHQYQVAYFYYRHRAYVAAANRASYVVEHFNGTPSVADALAVMVKSYRKLGLTKMANNSYHILQASYPKSTALSGLRS